MLSKAIQSTLFSRSIGSRAFASLSQKLAKFDYLDALQVEDHFTEEEKAIRDAARAYA